MLMYGAVALGPVCVCACVCVVLWLNVFPALSAIAAFCFSSAGTQHVAWIILLNSIHDFIDNHLTL